MTVRNIVQHIITKNDFRKVNYLINKMIKEARKKYGITQRQLALMVNLERSYISKLENRDKSINPTVKQIVKISKSLKIDPFSLSNWFVAHELNNQMKFEYAWEFGGIV